MVDELRKQFDEYIGELFAQEDDALSWIKAEIERNNMPAISLEPQDGYLLQWLMNLVNVKKAVEIGTLGGYSGTWIARALPDNGKLFTLEVNEKHARVARAGFEQAGVSDKVEVIEGSAHHSLESLSRQGPFDMVFIDADKGGYNAYLRWAVDNLRPGGLVAAHNAFRGGRVISPSDEEDRLIDSFNRSLADDPRLNGFIIPMGDGMAVAIKQ